jgi:LuxR family quorum-sensing transcriptional regulator LasR
MPDTLLNALLTRATPVHLTRKETAALEWAGRGKTSWEISVILDCSESTINFHIGNARRKFGVKSRHLAILLALQNNLIDISIESSDQRRGLQ